MKKIPTDIILLHEIKCTIPNIGGKNRVNKSGTFEVYALDIDAMIKWCMKQKSSTEMARAYIKCNGDHYAGIPGADILIDIGMYYSDMTPADREDIRCSLSDCWSEIWGEEVLVQFTDELKDD